MVTSIPVPLLTLSVFSYVKDGGAALSQQASLLPRSGAGRLSLCYSLEHGTDHFCFSQLATQTQTGDFCQFPGSQEGKRIFSYPELAHFPHFNLGLTTVLEMVDSLTTHWNILN